MLFYSYMPAYIFNALSNIEYCKRKYIHRKTAKPSHLQVSTLLLHSRKLHIFAGSLTFSQMHGFYWNQWSKGNIRLLKKYLSINQYPSQYLTQQSIPPTPPPKKKIKVKNQLQSHKLRQNLQHLL